MTISLTHLTDLQRVRIAISDRPDGTVRVERSTNEIHWRTVRGGAELAILDGEASPDDYEWDSSEILNHYRVVPVDPVTGLLLDGTAGNYASTPDDAVLDITGDIDLRAEAFAEDWTVFTTRTVTGKYNTIGDQRSYRITMIPGGTIRFQFSTDGADFDNRDSTVALPVTSGVVAIRVTVDVDNGAGGHTTTFYTSDSISGAWVQLGAAVVVAGAISFNAGTAPLEAGASNDGQSNAFFGVVRAVEIRNGIDGTVVANPDFAAQPHDITGFTDSAGRLWTVQGDALINGIESDSILPSLARKAWLKVPEFPFLNTELEDFGVSPYVRPGRATSNPVAGRSLGLGVADLRLGRQYTLEVLAQTKMDALRLDLILAGAQFIFLHVPPEIDIPGGHFLLAGDTSEDSMTGVGGSVPRLFGLSLVASVEPGPDIIGGTMTYGALLGLYGGYDNLLQANVEYRALLQLMATPDDLIVL